MTYLVPILGNFLHSYRIIALGKVARHLFPLTGTIPYDTNAGDVFYLVSLMVGILLWGFALVWFVVAIIMIATAYPFPFNMGWWGFIFPIGKSK
jgi:tellurite resistance protein TehA-like permease